MDLALSNKVGIVTGASRGKAAGIARTLAREGCKPRALAVTSAEPTTLAPRLPTIASAGVAGYEFVSTMAIFTSAKKAPANVVRRINPEIVAVLNDPEIKSRFSDAGADAIPGTPEQAMEKALSERQRLSRIIASLGPPGS